MRHPSYDPACDVCHANAGEAPSPGGVIFANDLWFVRHTPPPAPLAGWMMLHPQRHVQGPAHFTDEETENFGPVLRHLTRTLEQVTGALRIYVVAFGESVPHMHAHLAPRYAQMPNDAVAWSLSDTFRQVAGGELPGADQAEVDRIISDYRAALEANPPPR
ncbi:MAG: HIT domain-containing protein [Chloroflexi bacterium]|nr:HIT domain-containing protein [Chloroflexota bacterium]